MALTKSIQFKGLTVNNCYIKIWQFSGNKELITVNVGYYATSTDEMLKSVTFPNIPYAIGGGDPIAQAYLYIKTLGDYSDCTDC